MASSIRLFTLSLYQLSPHFSLHNPFPQFMSSRFSTSKPTIPFLCSYNTAIERTEKKQPKESQKKSKVHLRLRLRHQVEFGEHVAVLGSTAELGRWTKQMPMCWTENGWVCELEMRGGEAAEFKFVVMSDGGKGVVWEDGENRVVCVPESGVYDLACRWNETREAVDLREGESEDEVEFDGDGDGDGSKVKEDGVVVGAEGSLFVEQWKGRDVSFMRSNEHRDREIERRWDIKGLDGLALELVEGDKTARNWRGKV